MDTQYRRMTRAYIIGFVTSLLLTLAAYAMVTGQWKEGLVLMVLLAVLAVVQMVVQLIFFLHLGAEDRPRWRLIIFGFMMAILLIIVVGSLWIMHHLNYNMMGMNAVEKDMHMMEERDKGF